MKNGARDCTLLRGRKREIKEEKTERLRKRESTVINECDTESVCERERVRERVRERWVRTNFPWLVEPCYTVHPHPRWWKHMALCERVWEKRCDVWLCLCEATKEVRDKSVCALANAQMQPRKGFSGGSKFDSRAAVFDFRCHFGGNVDVNKHTRSRKGIKCCWWTKLSGAITPAEPTALSSSLCLFSQKAFSSPVQISRFLTEKRQRIHVYIQTAASNSL